MIRKTSMGAVTRGSQRWYADGVIIALIYCIAWTSNQVHCDEDVSGREISSNRVLPVDAEHQTKISTPLEPSCVQIIRDNLVKFVKRHPKRQARQDDGDDGDDGDGGEGIAGILGGLGEGNGALSTLSMLPQVLPQLVTTLTQLSGAVNQGLNGTDTPNIPSFLVAQGMQAIKLFQAIAGAANQGNRMPAEVHVQRIPGGASPPMRKPRPPGGIYEPYPGETGAAAAGGVHGSVGSLPAGLDVDDYLDEDVKQPLQPTLAPLVRPVNGGYEDNPFLQNADLLANQGLDGNANGLPQGTSLWNIYKSFRTRPEGVNGTLSDFQLAHPEAFSNELLQSISSAISSIRGQMGQQALAVATDRPNSEIFKQVYNNTEASPAPPPSFFLGGNRPTLSVYKPSGAISGVGIDLSNLALNHSQTVLNAAKEPTKPDEEPTSEEKEAASQPQQELEAASVGGPSRRPSGTLITTGTLEKLQAQNAATTRKPGGPQFVKSPTSSHLTLAQGEYIPAVTNLHETDDVLREVGPQLSTDDRKNGFNNRTPYKPVLNGILLEAPQLTTSSPQNWKRPTGLIINTDGDRNTEVRPEFTTRFPEFHFQVNDKNRPDLPPNFHGPDPTTRRAPTLIASIPNKYEYENSQPIKAGSGLAPSSLFAQPTDAVPESNWERETESPTPSAVEQDIQPPSDPRPMSTEAPPPPQRQPPRRQQPQLSQAQMNAQRLLQQLLGLQAILQRQQQNRFQQNVDKLQSVYDGSITTPPTTTTTLPPPPPPPIVVLPQIVHLPPVLPPNQFLPPPGYLQPGIFNGVPPPPKAGASTIANGFANALANNLTPGSTIVNNNRPAYTNGQPAPTFGIQPAVIGEASQNGNPNIFNTNTAPIRTTTKSPSTTSASPTTQSTVRFQQFPNFAEGPSSYFPNAGGSQAAPDKNKGASQSTAENGQSNQGVVQTKNPVLSNQFNNNNPSQLPQTTVQPITGAFAPYHPFGGFAIHLEDTSTQPSVSSQNLSTVSTTPTPTTTTTVVTSTTIPPLSSLSFVRPSGGYYPSAGLPLPVGAGSAASSSGTAPPFPPPAPPRSKPKPRPQVNDPYSIINNPHFQLPAQSGGYPQYVPKAPVLVTSSGLKTPTQSSTNSTVPLPVNATQTVSLATSSSPPLLISGDVLSAVAQQLEASPPPPKLASAIAEMSKLPFFQEESFRPSAIPPHLLGITSTSENPEDSGESQGEVQTEKPFEELFSSASNVSAVASTTAEPVTEKLNLSQVDENDSVEEQSYPNFPPGKPIYWMNMYYPNGIPVLTRVKTTTEAPTSPKPRRRRTRSTTTTIPTTTLSPEPEYYEDDDVGAEHKSKKKRRKTTTTAGTTEADFSS